MKNVFTFSKGLNITKADLVDKGMPVISYEQIHSNNNTGIHIIYFDDVNWKIFLHGAFPNFHYPTETEMPFRYITSALIAPSTSVCIELTP